MVAADVGSANRSSCCSLIRFSTSPRAQYRSSYRVRASIPLAGSEVTTKARVGAFGQMLGLGDDAALPAPAVQRAPGEIGEAAARAALGQALGLGCGQLRGDRANQAVVAGEAEQVIDGVRFAPRHPPAAGEGLGPSPQPGGRASPGQARVGAEDDLHPRPAGPDLGPDAFDLVDRAGCLAAGLGNGAPTPFPAAKRCLTA